MKKILLCAVCALAFASCQQNANSSGDAADSTVTNEMHPSQAVVDTTTSNSSNITVVNGDAPAISFETIDYNFGTINKGEKVRYSYKFKNVGKAPLIIANAEATCGCTVPEVPKTPIKPGAEGEIGVVFDSAGKTGLQDKVITITSNAAAPVVQLHLRGEILDK
jgi:hypothetical protein